MHRAAAHIPKSFDGFHTDNREYISDLLDTPDVLDNILPTVVPQLNLVTPNSTATVRRLVSSRPTSRVRRALERAGYSLTKKENCSVGTHSLKMLCNEWNADLVDSGRSAKTTTLRTMLVGRLQWFLEMGGYDTCGVDELQHFFRHLRDGHTLPRGRWGEGAANHGTKPLSPATLATYDRHFRSFFNFLVDAEIIDFSPMELMQKQQDTSDQKIPFTLKQVESLVRTAQASKYPRRNESIIRFLFDSGVRAGELCGLQMKDVDLFQRRARVLGKGNKNRLVAWGKRTGMALRAYMRDEYFSPEKLAPDDPLFIAATGKFAGEAMTTSGLRQLVNKLGRRAGVQIAQCSPHTFRHTFAIVYLRRGGDIQTLQFMMGHSSIKTTQGYVNMAKADIEAKYKSLSPGDALEI